MIRFDMSEYMEKFSVSRLIGAPPGYVGYEEGGQLTEAIRRRPYSVVLFDEIEKAHSDVFNILLQMLDDGRITDSKGRLINCKNTIIILTSNIGAEEILDSIDNSGEITEDVKNKVNEYIRQIFKPEFINRLDDIIIYKPLNKESLMKIFDIMVQDLRTILEDKKVTLTVTDKAKEHIIDEAYSPIYGARPLRRVIQNTLENNISKLILEKGITSNLNIIVDYENNNLVLKA